MGQRLDIEGTHNFRDVGGYAAGGSHTRYGQLYRSDALGAVTDVGAEALAELGIEVVVDLRSRLEHAQDQGADPLPGAQHLLVPIYRGSRSSIISDGHVSLELLYRQTLEESAYSFATAVAIIAESEMRPVLVHCTAGKDRTGLVVALALEAAGVDRTAVVADYTQSALNLDGAWIDRTISALVSHGVPISPALFEVLGGSPDHAMSRVLAGLDEEWGSVTGFLTAHGMQEESVELLHRKLVV